MPVLQVLKFNSQENKSESKADRLKRKNPESSQHLALACFVLCWAESSVFDPTGTVARQAPPSLAMLRQNIQ